MVRHCRLMASPNQLATPPLKSRNQMPQAILLKHLAMKKPKLNQNL